MNKIIIIGVISFRGAPEAEFQDPAGTEKNIRPEVPAGTGTLKFDKYGNI